jgi:hypothetical protein
LTKNTARVAARANDDVADPEVVMSTRLTAADVTICACEEDHVAAITTIYAHHVLHGLASFEIEPPSEDDMPSSYAWCTLPDLHGHEIVRAKSVIG